MFSVHWKSSIRHWQNFKHAMTAVLIFMQKGDRDLPGLEINSYCILKSECYKKKKLVQPYCCINLLKAITVPFLKQGYTLPLLRTIWCSVTVIRCYIHFIYSQVTVASSPNTWQNAISGPSYRMNAVIQTYFPLAHQLSLSIKILNPKAPLLCAPGIRAMQESRTPSS